MEYRKPIKIRSDVDDLKMSVIEHLTGEKLQRKSRFEELQPDTITVMVSVMAFISIGVLF